MGRGARLHVQVDRHLARGVPRVMLAHIDVVGVLGSRCTSRSTAASRSSRGPRSRTSTTGAGPASASCPRRRSAARPHAASNPPSSAPFLCSRWWWWEVCRGEGGGGGLTVPTSSRGRSRERRLTMFFTSFAGSAPNVGFCSKFAATTSTHRSCARRPRARALACQSPCPPPRLPSPSGAGATSACAPAPRRTLSGVRNGRRSGSWLPGDASAAAAAEVPPRPIANPRRQAGGWETPPPSPSFLWRPLPSGAAEGPGGDPGRRRRGSSSRREPREQPLVGPMGSR